jgi:hypothetical protein
MLNPIEVSTVGKGGIGTVRQPEATKKEFDMDIHNIEVSKEAKK